MTLKEAILETVIECPGTGPGEIANRLGRDKSNVRKAALDPPQLTAQILMRLTPRLPAGWAEQRKLLGFR